MLRFRLATAADADALAALNYRTFVEEIPQHAPNAVRRLVDRFDDENTYVVAEDVPDTDEASSGDGEARSEPQLVGMICIRARRPFSLDAKLPDLDAHLPKGRTPCEVRLLSVDPAFRSGAVFRGLVQVLADEALGRGYDLALISGTTRQTRLYRHLGFEAFGPLVGTADAAYQPMHLTLERFRQHAGTFVLPPDALASPPPPSPDAPATFLPGPVALWPGVAEAFARAPVSHRAEPFLHAMEHVRGRLCRMTGARHVQVLVGTGTLANDVVAGQLAALGTPGLVLAAGEFGDRLVDQAQRWGLDFFLRGKVLGCRLFRSRGSGSIRCASRNEMALDGPPRNVHGRAPRPADADACVRRAPCAAGAGCRFQPRHRPGRPVQRVARRVHERQGHGRARGPRARLPPRGACAEPAPAPLPRPRRVHGRGGGRGLHAVVAARVRALRRPARPRRPEPLRPRGARHGVGARAARALGLDVVGEEAYAAPGVVTFRPPKGVEAMGLGDALADAGYLVSYRSGYLAARGWLQICLMGDAPRAHLPGLLALLAEAAAS